MRLFSLLDKKTSEFSPAVMPAVNDALMVRMLQERVRPEDTLARFPEDFDLYELGVLDTATGRITQGEIRCVCNMSTVLDVPFHFPDRRS